MSSLKNYLIFLDPPDSPGSAMQRAYCDVVRKVQVGVSVNTASPLGDTSKSSDVKMDRPLQPRRGDRLPDVSSLRISNAASPRPFPLRVPTPRTYESRATTPPGGSSDSASDAASPTDTDSVGSISETSDSERSPIRTEASSHRLYNMPLYMPLPNAGASTSVSPGRVSVPNIPGYKAPSLEVLGRKFGFQVFSIRMKIDQEIPRNMTRMLSSANQTAFKLVFDPGYSAIWAIGSHCQKIEIPPSDAALPLTMPLNDQYYQGYYERTDTVAHAQIYMHPHCPNGGIESVVPATTHLPNVRYGCSKFINTSAVVVTLTERQHQMQFNNCVQWDKLSWNAPLTISSPIGVAHCLTEDLYSQSGIDGIIGFAPSDSQTIFNLQNPLEAPSVLASIQSTGQLAPTDNSDNGIVLYCAMRPFALWDKDHTQVLINRYPSWIALNKWPIQLPEQPEISTPQWSEKIRIFRRNGDMPTWNVLLLSMRFIGFEPNTGTWFPVPNGEIVFDGPGLVTLLDPGCAASWVPSKVVRCVRTALFPCQHNQNLDRQLGDRAMVTWTTDMTNRSPSEFNYAVEPANVNPHYRRVVYRFSSSSPRGNTVVEVTGPVDQFICSLNPRPTPMGRPGRPENEGVLFVAPPGSLGQGSSAFGAIFGVNFFQSMLVEFGKPGVQNRRPYVRLAPQWVNEIKNFGPPPHVDDD